MKVAKIINKRDFECIFINYNIVLDGCTPSFIKSQIFTILHSYKLNRKWKIWFGVDDFVNGSCQTLNIDAKGCQIKMCCMHE